jgi:hypothetical protein
MPKALDWIPHIREGGDEEEEEHIISRRAPTTQPKFCGRCGAVLPARARFCGRCGRVLPVRAEAPEPVGVGIGVHEGALTSALPIDRPELGRENMGQSALMPPGQGGMRRIPIMLRLGRSEQRAWLNLRDCQVEKDPSLPSVPVVTVEGLDVWPMPGQDPPEIQIRNARIRY